MIKIFLYMQYLMWLVKKIKEKPGSEITLTNNEIKDTMKVIKSLENRAILMEGTTTKSTSEEAEFFNFLVH